jgi:hypothetical protein
MNVVQFAMQSVEGQGVSVDSNVCRRYKEFVELHHRIHLSLEANNCQLSGLSDLPAKQTFPHIWSDNAIP